MQDVEAISTPFVCVCVCLCMRVKGSCRSTEGYERRQQAGGVCVSVCACWLGGSRGGVWFCAKELIKVTFVSDA